MLRTSPRERRELVTTCARGAFGFTAKEGKKDSTRKHKAGTTLAQVPNGPVDQTSSTRKEPKAEAPQLNKKKERREEPKDNLRSRPTIRP